MPQLSGDDNHNLPNNLSTIIKKLEKQDCWNDILYITVLYQFFECGFGLPHSDFKCYEFNETAMKHWAAMQLDQLFLCSNASSKYYKSLLCIGDDIRNHQVLLLGSASVYSLSEYLTINVYCRSIGTSTSHCFKSSDFTVKKNGVWSLKSMTQLALLVRNTLITPIKSHLFVLSRKSCLPILQKLPELVIKNICRYLSDRDKSSFLNAFKEKYS